MEIRDYFTILRRRWAAIAVVFICLMGIFTVYLIAKEKKTYTATSKLGVRAERRFFSDADREILRLNQSGYNYYTREALLGSKHVLDYASIIYLAVKGVDFKDDDVRERAFWKKPDQEEELKKLIEKHGLAKVTTRNGRIITLDPNREAIKAKLLEEGAPDFGAVNVVKPEERVQLISLTALALSPAEAKLLANSIAKGAVVYSRVEALGEVQKMVKEVESHLDRLSDQKKDADVADTPLSGEEELQRSLQSDLSRLEAKLEDLRSREEQIKLRTRSLWSHEHLDSTPYAGVQDNEGLTSPILEQLRGDIIALNVSTATKKFVWREQNPQLKRMREQL